MARFNRRPAYKKRPYKRAWYDRRYSAQQIAVKAWKATKYLKGLVNSEMLHVDKTYSAASINNGGVVTLLSNMAQGDTDSTRTGNSVLARSLTYRLKFDISSSVSHSSQVNFVLFWDTQQVGDTSPAYTDIFSSAIPEALMNLNTAGRFKIIKRQLISLTPATGGRPSIEVHGTFDFRKHIRFNGTASTDIQKNGLYVAFISNEATNTPNVTGLIRLGYHDN